MRKLLWLVVLLVVSWASLAQGQTTWRCDPVTVQPAPIVVPPAPVVAPTSYYANGSSMSNPCASPVSPMRAYYPVGAQTIAYPSYTAYRPLLPATQVPPGYYVGSGLLGQVKLYVPGQPVRNMLRYLSP